jgi:hypothetical protein
MTPPIPVEPRPEPGPGRAAAILARVLRLLRTDLGRRLSAVVAVTALFAAGVSALYANPDPVGATVRVPAAAPVAQVATTRPPATPKPAAKPAPRPAKLPGPGEVATAWYAARRHLAPSRVEALQQQKVAGDRVRVLVLARVGADRLDTALITVRRERSGWVVR